MKAKDIQKILIGYSEEHKKTGKSYHGYSAGIANIHRKGDDTTRYMIDDTDTVHVYKTDHYFNSCGRININELTGDDFELFNAYQVVKCGYLVSLDSKPINMMKVISNLRCYVENQSDGIKDKFPNLCGFGNQANTGSIDILSFHDMNGIGIYVETIRHFCNTNSGRRHYGVTYIPFKSTMDNNLSIHITMIENMIGKQHEEVKQNANDSVYNLISYMKDIGMEFKWVDTKIRKTIYV